MGNVKTAVLLLGSNLGDRNIQLAAARGLLAQVGTVGPESAVYETAAWGSRQQPAFLNQVVLLTTPLAPLALLDELQSIERAMGRKHTAKWAARIIDIDILFFGDEVFHSERLTIPHPQLAHRRFTLAPLAELLADFVHPESNQTVRELLARCTDPLPVERYVKR